MQHEILVELFKNRPSLAAELLNEALGEVIPQYDTADIAGADVTEIQPAEYRADLVIKLLKSLKTVLVIILEVQLAIDPNKRYSWPPYVTVAREEHRCPVLLLVVAPDPAVAAWCAEPIHLGIRGFVLEPPVLKSELIPKVTDAAEATRRPELALLSAMAYGDSDEAEEIGRAALEGFSSLDKKLGAFYADLLYNAINEATRRALEAKVKGYVYTSPWILEPLQTGIRIGRDEGLKLGRDEGRDEGFAEALLVLLRARSIDVPQAAHDRILREKDHARLQRWLQRAATATMLDEVLDEPN